MVVAIMKRGKPNAMVNAALGNGIEIGKPNPDFEKRVMLLILRGEGRRLTQEMRMRNEEWDVKPVVPLRRLLGKGIKRTVLEWESVGTVSFLCTTFCSRLLPPLTRHTDSAHSLKMTRTPWIAKRTQ
jgi:hypothetical protein